MSSLITGGSGYIGSYLAQVLMRRGEKVHVLDIVAPSYTGVQYHAHDVGDSGWVADFPDVSRVYHLAAVSRIADSLQDTWNAERTNVTGTMNALDLAAAHGAAFIYAGTSCCYDPLTLSPYHRTKWQGEELCREYAEKHGISIAIARLFNVYGSHGFYPPRPQLVVEVLEKALREKKPFPLIAEGSQRRDFIHISDVTAALIRMGDGHWKGEQFDIGTGMYHSIAEMVAWLKIPVYDIPARHFDVDERRADIAKTEKKLGWKAQVALHDYLIACKTA